MTSGPMRELRSSQLDKAEVYYVRPSIGVILLAGSFCLYQSYLLDAYLLTVTRTDLTTGLIFGVLLRMFLPPPKNFRYGILAASIWSSKLPFVSLR